MGWGNIKYGSPLDFKRDVQLVWSNCRLYNDTPGDAWIREMCEKCEELFDRLWKDQKFDLYYESKDGADLEEEEEEKEVKKKGSSKKKADEKKRKKGNAAAGQQGSSKKRQKAGRQEKRGAELVGEKVGIWWKLDARFYDAVVEAYNRRNRKHKILYEDGVSEWIDLAKEKVEWK